jgi:hypothetical protein
VGCALGLGLALMIVLVARPSANVAGLSATVRFTVPLSGELAVTPPAPLPVLVADRLRPGSPRATGRFEVQNQTGKTIGLGFRARPSSTALNGLVRVRLSAAGRLLADTTLQGALRTDGALRLPPGGTRQIELQAWMPLNVGDGYEGRQVDVSLLPVIARSRR